MSKDRPLLSNAKHWHDRASEARALAETLSEPEAKRLMLEIADGYEVLARRAAVRSQEENSG